MSKTIEYHCDRCGKKCEDIRNNRGFHIHRRYLFVNSRDDSCYDLCQSCYDDFLKWWKTGKKESENKNERDRVGN